MLRNIALSVASFAIAGTAFAADVICNSTNKGLSGNNPFSYSISAVNVSIFKDSRLQNVVALAPEERDYFLGGRKIIVYFRGSMINSKIFLYSYYNSESAIEKEVFLKHDRVDTFETNCEF